MPVPTCTCMICGKETTKRQTLLIQPYGRICRNHPEVEEHQEKMAEAEAKFQEAKKNIESARKIDNMMSTLAYVSIIRVSAYRAGLSVGVSALILWDKIPTDIRSEVLAEVHRLGDMTQQEVDESLLTYALMTLKK